MTDQPLDLEELKRLAAAATNGPWLADESFNTDFYLRAKRINGPTFAEFEKASDLRLTVAAVNSLPALIAEIEQLRGLLSTSALTSSLLRDSSSERPMFEPDTKNIQS